MAEYREIHTYDHEAPSNSTALAIFIIAALALLFVGLVMWQPWATTPTHDTTVITQPSNPAPDTTIVNPPSNTTIVNPPAEPPKTDIHIENKTEPPVSTGTTGTTGTTGN